MPSKHVSANPAPGQGEFFTGSNPDPHFEAAPEPGVVYGVYVDLLERNEALRSALSALGHIARGATFREIGNRQQEGSRSPAVRELESRFSQAELERRLDASRSASERRKSELDGDFRKAFGAEPLLGGKDSEERLEIRRRDGTVDALSEKDVAESLRWGGRYAPIHRQGKKEFMERFGGSNNRGSRDRYKRLLGRQATRIRGVKRQRQQHV